ncbi:MAG: AAA family ATPase [Planctomycetes bacterium]|nr:AAA family ATPase [Planctomycetota bacterium]
MDFGIVTVLEGDLDAVLAHIPPYRTVSGRRLYNLCHLETVAGDTYEIAVVRTLERGAVEASEVVRDLLEELSPSWLLIVGIAGGVRSSGIDLGDVVVSTRIAEMIATARGASGGGRRYSAGGGVIARDAASVVANLPALKQALAGWNKLSVPRPSSGGKRLSRVTSGVIASSDHIILDELILHSWMERVRGIKAVEMEAAGAYRVASMRSVPFIAIRGIADLIGTPKADDWRLYASHAAASFTAAFLRTRPIVPRSSRTHGTAVVAPILESTLASRDQRPFHFNELRLTDVRGFDRLVLPVSSPSKDRGQWQILLGANGVGKTTILRALALSLSSGEVVQALLGRLGVASPMVRLGATNATIEIECPAGYLPRVVLSAGETGDRLEHRRGGEVSAPFTVAYGCRRGSALGGSSREVNASSPLSAVETLFYEGAGLVHAETWLKERKLAATLSPGSPEEAFFNALIATLTDLLPGVTEIRVAADLVEVEGPQVGRIPFGALSDGYLTTAGWVLDMIARWAEDAKRRGVALDGSFHEQMTGLAIVDEIDLHLHPQWQRDVVAVVRGLFPRMSFVVTTHNPLTLLGGRPGEIHVLLRDPTADCIAVRQRDLPPGAGAERILTGEWFGLASTLDDDTLKVLEKHRRLLRTGSPDSPAARKIEAVLNARLGSYAVTSVERLAQSAAAQVLVEDARNLSAEDREAARVKIADLLRASAQPQKERRRRRKAN